METFNNNAINDDSILKDCLQKQIDELDIISSIFCNPGELVIDDHSTAADIHLFLSDQINYLTKALSYNVVLKEDGSKFEIRVEIPHFYPTIELASVNLTSSLLSKQNEKSINNQIKDLINTKLEDNSAYIYEIISWIQENLENFLDSQKIEEYIQVPEETVLERLWIYSHHIKSTTKRQTIISTANDYNLTGFSKPGKPGVICVEGTKPDTQQFWHIIKALKWQKISIKFVERATIKTVDKDKKSYDEQLKAFLKFPNFREVVFAEINMTENSSSNNKNVNSDGEETIIENDNIQEVLMNMSAFMKFLSQQNCGYIKKELFGFD